LLRNKKAIKIVSKQYVQSAESSPREKKAKDKNTSVDIKNK
jgi:hypothetical protein